MESLQQSPKSPKVSNSIGSEASDTDIFSPSRLSSKSVLGKRSFENNSNSFQKVVTKKAKISNQSEFQGLSALGSQERGIESQNRSIHNFLKNSLLQNHLLNMLLYQQIQQIQPKQINQYFEGLSNVRNQFQTIFNLEQSCSNHSQQTLSLKTFVSGQLEHIKIPEPRLEVTENNKIRNASGNLKIQSSLSIKDKKTKENVENEEPALAEFTKEFPEWDLRTIFDFINGDKGKNDCRKKKRVKSFIMNKKSASQSLL